MSPVQMLPIAAIGLLVVSVLLIGAGVMLRRSEGKGDAKRIARQKKELLAMPAEPEVEGASSQPVAGQTPRAAEMLVRAADPNPPAVQGPARQIPSDEVEILQVRRSAADGRISVNIFGNTARSARDLSPGQAEQLKRVLVELYTWLGKPDESSESSPPAGQESAQLPPASAPQPVPPAASTAATAANLSPDVPFAETLPKAPDLRDRLTFGRKTKAQISEAPPTPKSIVEQIDAILQQKLARSALSGRDIRMVELPGEGMMIVDGTHTYHGLEEVKDPDLMTLLRASVKEWDENNKLRPSNT